MDAYEANEKSKIKNIKLLLKIKYYYYYYYDYFTCWILLSVSTCVIAVIMWPGVYPSDTLANELMSITNMSAMLQYKTLPLYCKYKYQFNINILLIYMYKHVESLS